MGDNSSVSMSYSMDRFETYQDTRIREKKVNYSYGESESARYSGHFHISCACLLGYLVLTVTVED